MALQPQKRIRAKMALQPQKFIRSKMALQLPLKNNKGPLKGAFIVANHFDIFNWVGSIVAADACVNIAPIPRITTTTAIEANPNPLLEDLFIIYIPQLFLLSYLYNEVNVVTPL